MNDKTPIEKDNTKQDTQSASIENAASADIAENRNEHLTPETATPVAPESVADTVTQSGVVDEPKPVEPTAGLVNPVESTETPVPVEPAAAATTAADAATASAAASAPVAAENANADSTNPTSVAANPIPSAGSGTPPTTPPPTTPPTYYSAPSSAHASKKKGMGAGSVVAIVVAALLVVALGTWVVASISSFNQPVSPKDAVTSLAEKYTESKPDFNAPNQDLDQNLANVVAKEAMPSIVTIYTYQNPQQSPSSSYDYYDIMSYLMNGGQLDELVEEGNISEEEVESIMTGLGSGVIIRDDGYIITNNHVVEDADELMVSVGDESYEGVIVGTDAESDLAVVKIDAGDNKLTAIEVADSDNLEVGDWVMAIGAPLGYEQSATTGIVSALGRNTVMNNGKDGMTVYAEMIQTDAAINSGNSGGALVDDEARLIGINTLVAASDYGTQADNLGFAIPSSYAIAIANQIIDNDGVVSHAKLGIALAPNDSNEEGAVVSEVTDGSAAADAGVKQGDVIVRINGNKVADAEDVVYSVRASQPGDEMTLTVLHDGKESDIKVVLGGEDTWTTEITDESSKEDDSRSNAPENEQREKPGFNFDFHGGNER